MLLVLLLLLCEMMVRRRLVRMRVLMMVMVMMMMVIIVEIQVQGARAAIVAIRHHFCVLLLLVLRQGRSAIACRRFAELTATQIAQYATNKATTATKDRRCCRRVRIIRLLRLRLGLRANGRHDRVAIDERCAR